MIKSQFDYYRLVWMFCSRQSNKLINKVHKRDFRLTQRDDTKDIKQILREHNGIQYTHTHTHTHTHIHTRTQSIAATHRTSEIFGKF